MSATSVVATETYPCGCDTTGVCHTVACHDDDVAKCGADVRESNWCRDQANCRSPLCIVCEELDADESALPTGHPCVCPCCVDVPTSVLERAS